MAILTGCESDEPPSNEPPDSDNFHGEARAEPAASAAAAQPASHPRLSTRPCGSVVSELNAKFHTDDRIVIIGAGVAGLAAARRLSAFGFNVVVFEASMRPGGRAYTVDVGGSKVDMGAQWVHGVGETANPNPIAHLAAQLDIPLAPTATPEEPAAIFDRSGSQIPPETVKAAREGFEKLMDEMDNISESLRNALKRPSGPVEGVINEWLRRHTGSGRKRVGDSGLTTNIGTLTSGSSSGGGSGGGNGKGKGKRRWMSREIPVSARDLTMWEALNILSPVSPEHPDTSVRDAWMYFWMTLEDWDGNDLDSVSFINWFDEEDLFKGADAVLPNGYIEIVQHLARGLDIRYNTFAEKVVYYPNGDGADVYTADGSVHHARAVICTVSLGALKEEMVKFEPRLPAWKQMCIDRIGWGVLDKIVLKFDDLSFVQPADLDVFGVCHRGASLADPQDPSMGLPEARIRIVLNLFPATGEKVLIGFLHGRSAWFMEDELSDGQAVSLFLNALSNLFGVVPEPTHTYVTRWGHDPYARGSYSHLSPGSTRDHIEGLAAPVSDCLYFAGEATTCDGQGTVHGALLTGEREANRIIDAFGGDLELGYGPRARL